MRSFIPLLAVLAAAASAKTVIINVGQSGFTFSPDTNTAAVGDMLEFHFFGSIHSAVSGDFATPCQMGATGFDSGTIANTADGGVRPLTHYPSNTRIT
jgi:plastocyanin